jgi:hypothetical protein
MAQAGCPASAPSACGTVAWRAAAAYAGVFVGGDAGLGAGLAASVSGRSSHLAIIIRRRRAGCLHGPLCAYTVGATARGKARDG